MNLYARDMSLFDFSSFCEDPLIIPYSLHNSSSITSPDYNDDDILVVPKPKKSPPEHRHDGMSPLPLGMDWSLPPRKWEGKSSVWPHDPRSGWSYCVTIASWFIVPKSRSSEAVFYRVQVGIQSPEGITTARMISRRFRDFLQLLSELKGALPQKTLPPAPPKTILRMKRETLLEERRCSLEDWMERLLSDIDVSRSAPVGNFLELEAAARSYFDDVNQQSLDSSLSGMAPILFHSTSDISIHAGSSSIESNHGNDFTDEISELGTPKDGRNNGDELDTETSTSNKNSILEKLEAMPLDKMHTRTEKVGMAGRDKFSGNQSQEEHLNMDGMKSLPQVDHLRLDGHPWKLSHGSIESDLSSLRSSEISNLGMHNVFGDESLYLPEGDKTDKVTTSLSSDLHSARSVILALPSDKRHKLNRVLNTLHQRLGAAKTDIEDLIARLDQEVAMRQFLTTKVKDLEVDLETTRNSCKDNIQSAALIERERFTHMQWDVEELRRQCMELELKLKSEKEEKEHVKSTKDSIIQENEMFLQQLNIVRAELHNLRKDHEELEVKSKAEEKLLIKEVKSLRSTQSELKHELGRLMKEKIEVETVLLKEKQRAELVTTANLKLLHECEILRTRLQECSVNFLSEEEDKLTVNTSSLSNVTDLLATSDNRIGLLLAEAQLLAQDVEDSLAISDQTCKINSNEGNDDALRKMIAEVFIDNARLRMQMNSVIRCTIKSHAKSAEEEDTSVKKTVLSKFLER